MSNQEHIFTSPEGNFHLCRYTYEGSNAEMYDVLSVGDADKFGISIRFNVGSSGQRDYSQAFVCYTSGMFSPNSIKNFILVLEEAAAFVKKINGYFEDNNLL